MRNADARTPPPASWSATRALGIAALAVAAGGPLVARAQDPGSPAPAPTGAVSQLRGVVLSADEAPVAGAIVTLAPDGGVARTVTTAADGAFLFPGVESRPFELRVRRIGFRAESLSVTPPVGDAPVAVHLSAVPQALAPVVVKSGPSVRSGPLRDFYARKATGHGRYITRADIARRNPMYTTDLLRTVPGLMIVPGGGMNHIRIRGATCAPEFYLDGMPLGPMPLDVDAVVPSTIEGIEIYSGPATVPVQFARAFGRTACGTVLLWTREGEPRPRRSKAKPVTSEELARLVEGLQLFTAEQVDTAARPKEDVAAAVRLPDSVQVARGGAGVIAEFVVDSSGRVEPATINVVASPAVLLADVVRDALPGVEFLPARRGGRSVRQLVQLNVRFGATSPGR